LKFCSVKDQVLQVPSNLKANIQVTAEFSPTLEDHSDPVLTAATHFATPSHRRAQSNLFSEQSACPGYQQGDTFASQGGNIDMQKASFCASFCICANTPIPFILMTSESLHML